MACGACVGAASRGESTPSEGLLGAPPEDTVPPDRTHTLAVPAVGAPADCHDHNIGGDSGAEPDPLDRPAWHGFFPRAPRPLRHLRGRPLVRWPPLDGYSDAGGATRRERVRRHPLHRFDGYRHTADDPLLDWRNRRWRPLCDRYTDCSARPSAQRSRPLP
ncbi:hypothetical protein DSECCO2_404850 [anaerobic digester metagenome]